MLSRIPLRPLGARRFILWGVGLFALKALLDWQVSRAFGEPYSLLFYVSPTDAPLLRPGDHLPYWLTLWAVALPFIAVGLWLTVRRLRDAGAPPWLASLFFVPFANLLFFFACALLPSQPLPRPDPNYREPPAPPPKDWSFARAVVLASLGGATVALGVFGLAVGIFADYGASLFLGAPALSGFFATLLFARLHVLRPLGAVVVTILALVSSYSALVLSAAEGLICLLMAAPLATPAAAVGAVVGYAVASRVNPPVALRRTAPCVLLVPAVILAEVTSPRPDRDPSVVESTVVIDATPDQVWPHVIAFPELPPVEHWAFRAGVAAPTGAVIEGEGVGAVRRCRFTTGEFVEPIEVWEPGRELAFSVREQPDAMRELSPWGELHPPHLDGGFRTVRGQFLLEPLPGGRTLLRGRTWYTLDFAPQFYWRQWADYLIHGIHLRVLRHVERMTERS